MRRDRTGDPGLLYDMLAAAKPVADFVDGKTWNDYQASALLRSAVERQVTIIGEAAWQVSPETKAAHPEIPWIKISPTRHRLVHEYDQIDDAIVWSIATKHVPALISILTPIVPQSPESKT